MQLFAILAMFNRNLSKLLDFFLTALGIFLDFLNLCLLEVKLFLKKMQTE